MALPNPAITPLPNTEPDMIPSLWNKRYREIDENLINLDRRLEAIEASPQSGRRGKPVKDLREIYTGLIEDKEAIDVLIEHADEKFGDAKGVPGLLHLARNISDSLGRSLDDIEQHANLEIEREAA